VAVQCEWQVWGAHGDGDRAGGCPPSPLCLPPPHSIGTPVGTAAVSVHGSRDFRRPKCSEVVQTQLSDDAAAHSLHSKNPHMFQHFQTEMVRLGENSSAIVSDHADCPTVHMCTAGLSWGAVVTRYAL